MFHSFRVGGKCDRAAQLAERWHRWRETAPSPDLVSEVTDHGIGIGKGGLPHVFEPFYRGRTAAVAGAQGSGLELSIVRQIVEANRGQVLFPL